MRVYIETGYKYENVSHFHQNNQRIDNTLVVISLSKTTNQSLYSTRMATPIILYLIVAVITQISTALPMNDLTDARTKRTIARNGTAADIPAGLTFTVNMLLGCHQPTILPEVSGISQFTCPSGATSRTYKSLMTALDKVLQLYEFHERIIQDDDTSVEIRTLQIVVETVLNQTCQWIESLSMHYASDSNGIITCSSPGPDPMSDVKKLHSLITAYQLLNDSRASTWMLSNPSVNDRTWLRDSGVKPALRDLLTGTDYEIHLTNAAGVGQLCTACLGRH